MATELPAAAALATDQSKSRDATHILVELDPQDALLQPIRDSVRIKYTCLDVCSKYIALGASTGSVYIFQRKDLKYLLQLTGKDGSVSRLSFSRSSNRLAVVTWDNLILIWELNVEARKPPVQILSSPTHKDVGVSCLLWDDTDRRVFTGDERGWVSITNLDSKKPSGLFKMLSEVILKADSAIVQLDYYREELLVSTMTRCHVCFTKRKKCTTIGKKLRDGSFGACFSQPSANGDVVVLSARPGSRIWEANSSGEVLKTHQFKKLLAIPPLPVVSSGISFPSSDDKENIRAQSLRFTRLSCIGLRFLLATAATGGLYILDLHSVEAVLYTDSIRDTGNMSIQGKDIYCLSTASQKVQRYTLCSIANAAAKLLRRNLLQESLRLCLNFASCIKARPSRTHLPIHVMKDLLQLLERDKNDMGTEPMITRFRQLVDEIELGLSEVTGSLDNVSLASSQGSTDSGESTSVRLESGIHRIRRRNDSEDSVGNQKDFSLLELNSVQIKEEVSEGIQEESQSVGIDLGSVEALEESEQWGESGAIELEDLDCAAEQMEDEGTPESVDFFEGDVREAAKKISREISDEVFDEQDDVITGDPSNSRNMATCLIEQEMDQSRVNASRPSQDKVERRDGEERFSDTDGVFDQAAMNGQQDLTHTTQTTESAKEKLDKTSIIKSKMVLSDPLENTSERSQNLNQARVGKGRVVASDPFDTSQNSQNLEQVGNVVEERENGSLAVAEGKANGSLVDEGAIVTEEILGVMSEDGSSSSGAVLDVEKSSLCDEFHLECITKDDLSATEDIDNLPETLLDEVNDTGEERSLLEQDHLVAESIVDNAPSVVTDENHLKKVSALQDANEENGGTVSQVTLPVPGTGSLEATVTDPNSASPSHRLMDVTGADNPGLPEIGNLHSSPSIPDVLTDHRESLVGSHRGIVTTAVNLDGTDDTPSAIREVLSLKMEPTPNSPGDEETKKAIDGGKDDAKIFSTSGEAGRTTTNSILQSYSPNSSQSLPDVLPPTQLPPNGKERDSSPVEDELASASSNSFLNRSLSGEDMEEAQWGTEDRAEQVFQRSPFTKRRRSLSSPPETIHVHKDWTDGIPNAAEMGHEESFKQSFASSEANICHTSFPDVPEDLSLYLRAGVKFTKSDSEHPEMEEVIFVESQLEKPSLDSTSEEVTPNMGRSLSNGVKDLVLESTNGDQKVRAKESSPSKIFKSFSGKLAAKRRSLLHRPRSLENIRDDKIYSSDRGKVAGSAILETAVDRQSSDGRGQLDLSGCPLERGSGSEPSIFHATNTTGAESEESESSSVTIIDDHGPESDSASEEGGQAQAISRSLPSPGSNGFLAPETPSAEEPVKRLFLKPKDQTKKLKKSKRGPRVAHIGVVKAPTPRSSPKHSPSQPVSPAPPLSSTRTSTPQNTITLPPPFTPPVCDVKTPDTGGESIGQSKPKNKESHGISTDGLVKVGKSFKTVTKSLSQKLNKKSPLKKLRNSSTSVPEQQEVQVKVEPHSEQLLALQEATDTARQALGNSDNTKETVPAILSTWLKTLLESLEVVSRDDAILRNTDKMDSSETDSASYSSSPSSNGQGPNQSSQREISTDQSEEVSELMPDRVCSAAGLPGHPNVNASGRGDSLGEYSVEGGNKCKQGSTIGEDGSSTNQGRSEIATVSCHDREMGDQLIPAADKVFSSGMTVFSSNELHTSNTPDDQIIEASVRRGGDFNELGTSTAHENRNSDFVMKRDHKNSLTFLADSVYSPTLVGADLNPSVENCEVNGDCAPSPGIENNTLSQHQGNQFSLDGNNLSAQMISVDSPSVTLNAMQLLGLSDELLGHCSELAMACFEHNVFLPDPENVDGCTGVASGPIEGHSTAESIKQASLCKDTESCEAIITGNSAEGTVCIDDDGIQRSESRGKDAASGSIGRTPSITKIAGNSLPGLESQEKRGPELPNEAGAFKVPRDVKVSAKSVEVSAHSTSGRESKLFNGKGDKVKEDVAGVVRASEDVEVPAEKVRVLSEDVEASAGDVEVLADPGLAYSTSGGEKKTYAGKGDDVQGIGGGTQGGCEVHLSGPDATMAVEIERDDSASQFLWKLCPLLDPAQVRRIIDGWGHKERTFRCLVLAEGHVTTDPMWEKVRNVTAETVVDISRQLRSLVMEKPILVMACLLRLAGLPLPLLDMAELLHQCYPYIRYWEAVLLLSESKSGHADIIRYITSVTDSIHQGNRRSSFTKELGDVSVRRRVLRAALTDKSPDRADVICSMCEVKPLPFSHLAVWSHQELIALLLELSQGPGYWPVFLGECRRHGHWLGVIKLLKANGRRQLTLDTVLALSDQRLLVEPAGVLPQSFAEWHQVLSFLLPNFSVLNPSRLWQQSPGQRPLHRLCVDCHRELITSGGIAPVTDSVVDHHETRTGDSATGIAGLPVTSFQVSRNYISKERPDRSEPPPNDDFKKSHGSETITVNSDSNGSSEHSDSCCDVTHSDSFNADVGGTESSENAVKPIAEETSGSPPSRETNDHDSHEFQGNSDLDNLSDCPVDESKSKDSLAPDDVQRVASIIDKADMNNCNNQNGDRSSKEDLFDESKSNKFLAPDDVQGVASNIDEADMNYCNNCNNDHSPREDLEDSHKHKLGDNRHGGSDGASEQVPSDEDTGSNSQVPYKIGPWWITWEKTADTLLKTVGPLSAVKLLQSYKIPRGALSRDFFRQCLQRATAEARQKDKVEDGMDRTVRVAVHPLLQRQIQADIVSNGRTIPFAGQDSWLTIPAVMGANKMHWGREVDLSSDCQMCGWSLHSFKTGLCVYPCGHIYHKDCTSGKICIICSD